MAEHHEFHFNVIGVSKYEENYKPIDVCSSMKQEEY